MSDAASEIGIQFCSIDPDRDLVLTIGTFDGVHLGHRRLVQQVVRRGQERGCLSAAITFYPHPRAVVTGQGPACLCTLDDRLTLLRELGLDAVEVLPFTRDLAGLPAPDFMALLCRSLRLRELWVGSDFALGRGREGTVARLAEIGRELGFDVRGVPPFVVRGQVVSSTLTRELVGQGRVEAAAGLLRRRYYLRGTALPGDHRDRDLGGAAAIVAVSGGMAVPAAGLYATMVRADARQWPATARVEPTLASTALRLTVSVPDAFHDLAGQSLQVEFLRRLPPGVPTRPGREPADKVRVRRQVLSPA
ncbi:MAG: bifunctional riboflavin kinase/FMN adenylyltransferase [Anaerolineaceae bacterium]|nr:bifunctional riboflavin kinase/FMN adenylyltransferase [Anaerolineaceae bacterium]